MIKWNRREFMQASTASLLLNGLKVSALNGGPDKVDGNDSAFVRTNDEGKSWTLGNALVEREIHFDPKLGLRTASWRHKVTGTEFMGAGGKWGPQGHEFSVLVDGDSFRGSNGSAWELIDAKTQKLTPSARSLIVNLRAKTKPVDVAIFYAVYDTHPIVQKWIAITNRGAAPVTLSHFIFESVGVAAGPPDVLQVSGFYGSQPRELFFTGRVDDTAVLERNSLTGEGFIALNGAPGYTKRTELAGWGEGLELMYDTDLFPFERSLQPGETFTSAKSSIAFFVDGRGFADPRWVIPAYTSQVLMKKGPGYQSPWIYNTWEPFERGITKEITMDLISAAGRMGLDVFTIDDGWQADYGDNAINRQLFPDGLDEIRAAVERRGMRLGLWVPLAAISTNTAVYREHPEWVCKDRDGKPKFTGTMAGSQAVMCLASPYREVAAKRISDLIGLYHLAYVKVDLTTVFNAYGESPGCYAEGHDHRTWAESLERIYEGIQYVTDRIYRDHPEVLLDLTFELWGQKHIIDYGLLAAGDLDWLSNVDDGRPGSAGPRQARTLLYMRSLAIPCETMLIGNLQAEMPSIEERLATAMGAGPLFLGDLRKLTPAQQDWYGEKIHWFKALRKDVALLDGFFPLGNWQQPGAATWDGFARLSRQGEGMIALFKNNSHHEEVDVALPVFPDGTFHLRSAMTGQTLGTHTGEEFRRGIKILLPPEHNTLVLEIRR
ncbi:MAG TPA: glycoside hydrolase family 36 protein [Terriglobia bacterium]|nr:glycoside hydrolase family 36 protein [Terriglobia bacterium]